MRRWRAARGSSPRSLTALAHTPFPRSAPQLASIPMSEHKARAAVKFRRPTKALALQKLDLKYLLILRRRFTPPECATSLGLRRPMSGSSIHTCRTSGPWLCWASGRARTHDQGLAAEHAVSILLSRRSIGLPRYADCNNDDDERGSLPVSDNEKGLLRLSLSNEAIGRSTRSFWSSAKNCVRLQSRCDSAVRELTKTYRRSNIAR